MTGKIKSFVLSGLVFGYFFAFVAVPILVNLVNSPVFAASEVVQDGEVLATPQQVKIIEPVDITPSQTKKVQKTVTIQRTAQNKSADKKGDEFSVQAILSANNSAVIAAPMDGTLVQFALQSGDTFQKDDILAQFECTMETSKVKEIEARVRASNRQLKAYNRLIKLDAVADVEYISAKEANAQEKALLKQAQARASLCVVFAPFDGRVSKKMANNFEAIKSGRVLMEISSTEPLQADFLIPSVWLQWINIGEPVEIYVTESDKTYNAKIIRIHGQVDPVTKTVHAVAKLDEYSEELLPGMSGLASVHKNPDHYSTVGFLGLNLGEGNGRETTSK